MQRFLAGAPGSVWTAIIVGLMLLSQWMTTYFEGVSWVPPVAGLIALVVVPVLKVLFEEQDADRRYVDTVRKSAFERWLL